MANEITITLGLTVTKGTVTHTANTVAKRFDQSASTGGYAVVWVDVGTTAENITFGDLTPGFILMRNHDATNFVEFGKNDSSTLKEIGKLRANGGVAFFELASGETLMAKADTAACKVEVIAYNA